MPHNQKLIKIISLFTPLAAGTLFLVATLLSVSPLAAAPTDLFFSEYVEGSSRNKALEIYNGTGQTVDLSTYSVELHSNGSFAASQSITLSGTLDDSDVFVLAHGSAVATITNVADLISSSVINFNGDDAVALTKNGLVIDVIGQIGYDPGSKWGSGDTSTLDNTIRRKASIETGDANGSDPFDPAVEWDGFPKDTFDGLGWHLNPPLTPTPTFTATPPITGTATTTSTSIATSTPTATMAVTVSPTVTGTPNATPTPAVTLPAPGDVVFNEIAWAGTIGSSSDEWIELLNTTSQTITLSGLIITSTNGLNIPLNGTIAPNDYYLVERTDDNTISDVTANLTVSFGSGLSNGGDSLFLSSNGIIIDTANADGGPWPAGIGSPVYQSMERVDSLLPDTDDNWLSNNTIHRNGQDVADEPINGTPNQPNSTTYPPIPTPTATPLPPSAPLLISEVVYDGLTPSTEGDEFIELCNLSGQMVSLTSHKVGDEEVGGGGESMYQFPITATLAANGCLVVAKNATQFAARFNRLPDYEVTVSGGSYTDDPNVPNLSKYTAWGRGSWSLSNNGDELVVLGPNDEILDSVAYRNGDYAGLNLEPGATAPQPKSLQRVWPIDTNSMPNDFVLTDPNPGRPTSPPPPPALRVPPASLLGGMNAYWGDLHSHTTYSDGAGPPHYALAMARAAGLHFYAITDHGWWLTDSEWARTLTQTRNATVPGEFVALRGLEWTHETVGHINIFNSPTLLSRTDPMFSELPDLYTWLAAQPEVIAQFNHPDPRYGGTFYDFLLHPAAARVVFMQEIGNNAQTYTTYEPSFVRSNTLGWRVAPTNNGDTHTAGWGSDSTARTGLVAPALTEADLLAAMRARRVFATEDSNLALTLRAGDIWMGSVLTATGPLELIVDFVDPDPEPLTLYLYDGNLPLATVPFATSTGRWSTSVNALPGHYFWVKAIQSDGQAAYTAPVWLAGQALPETIYINEILPAPHDWDWDGNGTADYTDEWIEVYNPLGRAVGLGGWRLADSSGAAYDIPLGVVIPPGGFVTFYQAQFGFSLNNSGETVSLIHPNGTTVDIFDYDHSPGYDESWCRLPDGGPVWSDECGPSPHEPNWEQQPAGPLHVSIYDAKRLTRGAWVRVKGHVTAPPGVLGARNMYIQDSTAGILIYLPKDHRHHFNRGDRVEVTGNLRSFHEEFEIAVSRHSDVKFLETGVAPPPLPIATTSLLEPYEGRLVMLQGQVVQFKGRTRMWIDDGTGWAQVYIRSSTGIKKPFIEIGTPVTVVGIVSQYSNPENPSRNDYRLLPRDQADLTFPTESPPSVPAGWPALLPETGIR